MIKITVICVGKIKETDFAAAIGEYEKRLSAFCRLETVEIKPEQLPENPSEANISAALAAEAEKIRARIPKDAAVYPLCVKGKRLTSEEFSNSLAGKINEGKNVCFIIGGSHGLYKSIENTGEKISFSDMTFPHRLFRVMLLEQIYRAFTIIAGKKYHK